MIYELWDIAAGRALARSTNKAELLAQVRVLLASYGSAYADDLELGGEDERGDLVERSTGSVLAAQAEATSPVGIR